MLPGLSGIELARRIRRGKNSSGVPIIMLTAKNNEKDKLKGFDLGIDDYITKPFSVKELIARMKAILRNRFFVTPYYLCRFGDPSLSS